MVDKNYIDLKTIIPEALECLQDIATSLQNIDISLRKISEKEQAIHNVLLEIRDNQE